LAWQGEDGQRAGGALFPARPVDADPDQQPAAPKGQPWTATACSLVALRDFGVDPESEQMRRTGALVSSDEGP
jgi:hypothetical protein